MLSRLSQSKPAPLAVPESSPAGETTVLAMVWGGKGIIFATVAVCLIGAAVYVSMASRVYRATARVRVDETAPKVLKEDASVVVRSDTFVNTQAAAMESQAVLKHALNRINYADLETFKGVSGDPVAWLRKSGALSIEVMRKTDVIEVGMQSTNPNDAATIANAVVDAYFHQEAERSRQDGRAMIAALQNEKQALIRKRDANVARMMEAKLKHGTVSFGDDRGNIAVERAAELSRALTAAEVAVIEFRSQQEAATEAMKSPAELSAFVEALQRSVDVTVNAEYAELKKQRATYLTTFSNAADVQGSNSAYLRQLSKTIASLSEQITEHERKMAQGHLLTIAASLQSAQAKVNQLRLAAQKQQEVMLGMNPVAAEYNRLAAEAERAERQCDLIEARIAEISVNRIDAKPTSLDFMERATPQMQPVSPKRTMVLAVATMLGCVIGTGLAMLRAMRDTSMRSPTEVAPLLGIELLAMVPPIVEGLSASERGRLLEMAPRSRAAEAYRDIRTSIQLGRERSDAQIILVASPASGDGKSTTASNLAIAFAKSGERTLIIDCDLRQPTLHRIFQIGASQGLCAALRGRIKMAKAIRQTTITGLSMLPCGPTPPDPAELLTSTRFLRLLRGVATRYDRVIIDSPPILDVTDARILASIADATVLVLRMNQSVRHLGVTAVEALNSVGANIIGAVANDAMHTPSYGYSHYGFIDKPQRTRALTSVSVSDRPSSQRTPVDRSGHSQPAHAGSDGGASQRYANGNAGINRSPD